MLIFSGREDDGLQRITKTKLDTSKADEHKNIGKHLREKYVEDVTKYAIVFIERGLRCFANDSRQTCGPIVSISADKKLFSFTQFRNNIERSGSYDWICCRRIR